MQPAAISQFVGLCLCLGVSWLGSVSGSMTFAMTSPFGVCELFLKNTSKYSGCQRTISNGIKQKTRENVMFYAGFWTLWDGKKHRLGTGGRNRTGTGSPPRDFESRASTNFATPATPEHYR